ncbi:MAG TPA: LysM peptidoglycan-binding domain-containing protein [Gemmatimonadales bacterium]|nr:LysM peptidoglycan-binding domain-containing protein [Gemmatimonadales bacterium]
MPRVTARTLALALAVALPAPLLAQQPSADVPETHTVKQGDTLWGLAQQYFNDPLQWPRLYQMNTAVVEDPHWIYPGEVLRLRSDVAVESVPAADTIAVTVAPAGQPVTPVSGDSADRQAVVAETVPQDTAQAVVADTTPIFPRAGMTATVPTFTADFSDNYRAVTRADFFQAGFMTEGKAWPLGTLLGVIAPMQVDASTSGSAYPFSTVAITPPAAGAYQVGDTLLALSVGSNVSGGFGAPVTPLGLIRVTDVSQPKLLGRVIQQYGQLSPDTRVMLAEKYSDRRGVRAQPVADGADGTIIAFRSDDVLRGVGDIAFIDKGRDAGMQIGDVLEAHRTSVPHGTVPALVPEVVARLQVVHVGDKTATVRFTWVAFPDLPLGTRWKLVARLPG